MSLTARCAANRKVWIAGGPRAKRNVLAIKSHTLYLLGSGPVPLAAAMDFGQREYDCARLLEPCTRLGSDSTGYARRVVYAFDREARS